MMGSFLYPTLMIHFHLWCPICQYSYFSLTSPNYTWMWEGLKSHLLSFSWSCIWTLLNQTNLYTASYIHIWLILTPWPKGTPNTSISLPSLYNWLDLQMMASFDPMPKRRSSLSFFKTSTALLLCKYVVDLLVKAAKVLFFRHWPFNAILVWHILITQPHSQVSPAQYMWLLSTMGWHHF